MSNRVNYLIWIVIGSVLVTLASVFYIGSKEQLEKDLTVNIYRFTIGKILFSFLISIIWAFFSYFLYKAFVEERGKIFTFRLFVFSSLMI